MTSHTEKQIFQLENDIQQTEIEILNLANEIKTCHLGSIGAVKLDRAVAKYRLARQKAKLTYYCALYNAKEAHEARVDLIANA